MTMTVVICTRELAYSHSWRYSMWR